MEEIKYEDIITKDAASWRFIADTLAVHPAWKFEISVQNGWLTTEIIKSQRRCVKNVTLSGGCVLNVTYDTV